MNQPSGRGSLLTPVALLCLIGLACATTGPPFHVVIDGLRDPEAGAAMRTYLIYPGMDGVAPTDLQFKEFARQTHRALQARGFVPAEPDAKADIMVFLSYGIGEPQATHYSYPVFGQTGGGSATFSGSTYGTGGTTHTTGTVTTPPQYGIVGVGTGTRTQYFRWANIEAVDIESFLKTQEIHQVWRTTITSSGSSGDLRRVFPILIAAGQPYLGASTGSQIRRTMTESSPEVVAVRGNQR